MDPATTFCPNLACPARGQTGQGNIRIHARKDQRFMGTECHRTFSATQGTVLDRLRTAAETVSLVVTLLAHGCPLQAIGGAFGFAERTVARWPHALASSAKPCRSTWASHHATWDKCQGMRSASRPNGAWCDGPCHGGEPALRPTPDSTPERAGALLCGKPTAVGLYRRVRRFCPSDSRDLSRPSPHGRPRASPAAPLAPRLHRPSREALRAAARRRRRAAYG
jgi:transposase-like protein